ncbi:MAG: UTP--glucose-1-phosphate uridylyltransferase [Candidatus Nealsonbacteria bacterium CG_4_10_14_0_2_um_filter_40_15]|uniref:UTP--glucose-1-phosphate uridylyltransferase n=2 Tax=Candidatus Nealsoniibacteriota TaxID=1817911 RepID=A0A2M7D7J1_9BACT|nr:MAG: UTP--glucose-1-phosphate uridylyltransferase [Candidatus Nealsonbacteria bacterium CG02_land_8_20_14_3_00_40_11]PIZ87673.1 MAG: UTP--glucose-1-phosphate uridylyltransferase [Candidatus Nealsonbacteria bacterium CG_4_10_14_0_2_um_filter_40_15]
MEIKKAIIPIAGLGTRFLPLSKVVPKEFWPLVDKPAIQYIIEEAVASGIEEIIFVAKPEETKAIEYFKNYFKKEPKLKEILKKRKRNHLIEELKKLEKISKSISFSQAFQKEPLGASHAVLQAVKLVKNEPCAVLYGDDVIESKIPCLLQLIKVFQKYKKPVMALYRIPKENFQFYGMVEVEKIAKRLFRIKRTVEKPSVKESPSNLAIVGKYIITPEVFNYLKKTSFDLKSDITLSTTLGDMAESGKEIYGYEFEGKWLECGNKLAYLKSNLYLTLKHPQFGKELRKYLRTW